MLKPFEIKFIVVLFAVMFTSMFTYTVAKNSVLVCEFVESRKLDST